MPRMDRDSEFYSRKAFCNIDDEAAKILRAHHEFIRPTIARIIDRYFRKVALDAKARAYYGDVAPLARSELNRHWNIVLEGAYGEAYEKSIVAIGELHARLGPPHWFVSSYLCLLSELVTDVMESVPARRFGGADRSGRAKLVAQLVKAGMFDVVCAVAAFRDAGNRAREAMISQLIDRIRGKSGAAISTIAQAAIDLEAVTKTMTAEAEMTSATAASIVHAAEMASGNVRAVAGATERFLISVQEISRQIKESVATSRVAVEIARKTVDNATRLSEEARRIGDIVQLIAGIAEQTNLLALNATIESARAGDAGKGFAVVAQEVKTLAMQTAQAAKQVSGQIAGIQSSTGDALSAMAHITDAINDMSKSAAVVAEAAAQQQINVNEIAANINEASKRTDDVASNIAEVENAAGRTRTISDRVLILAQSVTEQTGHLDRDMSTFFETARFA